MRLPKQALSYTSLVVAAKHSKDLSTIEDKFRERENSFISKTCWGTRNGDAGEDGGRGVGFLTTVSAHSQTQQASPSPTATILSLPKS